MDLLVSLLTLTCVTAVKAVADLHPLSDAFIDRINSEQDSWLAGRNFPEDTPLEILKRLHGARRYDSDKAIFEILPHVKHSAELIESLPENFDPREKWTNCPSLDEVRDQGACGSSWAMAAASAMTDRICIHSEGKKQFHVSAEDILACSNDGECNVGCPPCVWNTWATEGFVSGGNYNSSQGCMPYSVPGCIHHGSAEDGLEPCSDSPPTPRCTLQCRSGYNVSYENDKQRGKQVYILKEEEQIMADLYTNGPAEATFVVYEDFLNYKEGVYYHHSGDPIGYLSVKLMGWGTDKGQKYWLSANVYNKHWGAKGYFNIRRGTSECGIEDEVVAAEPLLN